MSRPPAMPAEDKLKIILTVLGGGTSIAEAARNAKVSEQSVGNWKRQFIEGGRRGLEGSAGRINDREKELQEEISELKTALGEAYIELRARRRVADYRQVPTRPLRRFDARAVSPSQGFADSWASPVVRTPVGR
ncbi:transposase [Streptomyces kaniharaensis]|uniref:Transposase n=1 Tax=Streptomyces kaniharaensis TaxID=212423 RepID=A0A6N7KRN9_9ACTN|nr:transposase [Streptomyces kaniharaensis]MQS12987.1 transposase [Streptomyces kaniharaensis]